MTTKCIINKSTMTGIADAIRAKGGTTETMKPGEMAAKIDAIPSGVDELSEPEWYEDGNSHLWVKADEERGRIVRIGIDPKDPQTISWGDGEITSIRTNGVYQHEYEEYGDYIITISPQTDGGVFSPGYSSSYTFLGMVRTSYKYINHTWPVWAMELGENCNSTQSTNNWQNMHSVMLLWLKVESTKATFWNQNFSYCTFLKKVDLSQMTACTRYCSYLQTFSGCLSLEEIVFPQSITTIAASGSWIGSTKIKSLTLPNSLTSITDSFFNSGKLLKELVIPDSVTAIGNYLVLQSYGLEKLVIGSGVQTIGSNMIQQCNNLNTIIMRPTMPPTLASFGTFTPTSDFKIIVPVGAGDAYRNAEVWSTMAQYIEEGDVGV